MKIIDAISAILQREGVEFLSTYPTTPLIDAAAAIGIRPILCRQERVGVDKKQELPLGWEGLDRAAQQERQRQQRRGEGDPCALHGAGST
mgnify:CR=1 FL=1